MSQFAVEEEEEPVTTNNLNYSFKFNEIKWQNVILIVSFHIVAVYAEYLYIIGEIKWQNAIFAWIFGAMSALGVTIGAHRLWSHRSFKAKWPLRLMLAFWNTCALETDIYDWSRDHRVHHRFSETNADPYNSSRGMLVGTLGFFFSHVGWLMLKKHPDVIEAGRKIDLSDLQSDPIVRLQRRYYLPLSLLCWAVLPTVISMWAFNEKPLYAFIYCVIFRYVYVVNVTWSVNSSAHRFGYRPYNVNIAPAESRAVTFLSLGEGYHNYHHAFPFDYSASEFGVLDNFNVSTALIDLFAALGLAYDLKKPKVESILARVKKSGDESVKVEPSTCWTKTAADWLLGGFVSIFGIIIFGIGLRIIVTGGLYNKE